MINFELANSLLIKNKEHFLSNALLAREVQKNKYDTNLIFNLGKGFLKNLNFDAAKKCFFYLKQTHPTQFEFCYYYAFTCESLGNINEAREVYLDSLLLSTTDLNLLFESYKNIGNIYLKDKDIDTA